MALIFVLVSLSGSDDSAPLADCKAKARPRLDRLVEAQQAPLQGRTVELDQLDNCHVGQPPAVQGTVQGAPTRAIRRDFLAAGWQPVLNSRTRMTSPDGQYVVTLNPGTIGDADPYTAFLLYFATDPSDN